MDDYVTEDDVAELLDTSWDRLEELGSHIVELERHFGTQRGRDRDDDRLPYDLPDFQRALDQYYDIRGWRQDGTIESLTPLTVST
jgi:aldehyde:ferredoxin oxidoreductase